MASLNEQREAAGRDLAMARSRALDAYAGIEQGLCWVMARLANMDIHPATIIYFRIGAHPRNVILDDLMKSEHGDTYQPFWDTMMKRIRGLDGMRNNVVHWHGAVNISATTASVGLSRPGTWFTDEPLSQITTSEIEAFSIECEFVARSLNMFHTFISGRMQKSPSARETWLEIFQQRVVYPPPDTHPLFPIWKERQIPRQPSRT